jgi:ketosteroid isomerase-like protein
MKVLAGLALATMLAVTPGWTQTRSTPEQELVALENAWSRASVNRDKVAMERFYADEYIFTNEDGTVSNKAKDITDSTTGEFHLMSYQFEDMKVHLYGDVAVVTGRNTIKGIWEDINHDISGPYRFTDVFVKRNGRWQCVASQSSRVVAR